MLRSAILLPLLVVAVVSFVWVRGNAGDGDTLVIRQQHDQSLTPQSVAAVVRAAPDPVTRRRGLAARCSSLGSGALRNPWRCSIRYRSGRDIQYRLTIHADGSYTGGDEIVRFHGRTHPD